jgi:hypothetical protein
MMIGHPLAGAKNIAIAHRPLSRSLAVLVLLMLSPAANAQTVVPTNADPATCTVTQDEFNGWFGPTGVTKDGIVGPADSLAFNSPPEKTCPFFKWSQQMFLWLTSPLGGGRHVFGSPTFYAVSPADTNNKRTLIPSTPNQVFSFNPSINQRGSEGQEVAFDSKGKLHEIQRPDGKFLTLNRAGQSVEIDSIQTARNSKPVLLDKADKPIDVRNAKSGARVLRDRSGATFNLQASTVLVNGTPRAVTASGKIIETEQGQAGGTVLMAQNGSLVYYLLQVNNVFAYFKTGVQNDQISPVQTEFPTGQDLLDKITAVARQAPPPHTLPPGSPLPFGKALTMEVKSAWIETTNLTNLDDYITIDATIPAFTKTDTMWTPSGTQPAKLALVGMHVVGTVSGHPEMIWATYEHVNNAPNAPYTYNTSSGTVAGPAPGPGPWLFSKSGASSGPITAKMKADSSNPDTVVAFPGKTIGPSDAYRQNAWGSTSPDPVRNTEIVSINNSVFGKLIAGDVRKKYIMVGAIWTDGTPPQQTTGPNPTNNFKGAKALANVTMETFLQNSNCLRCHKDNMLGSPPGPGGFSGGLSHIWSQMQPLFPK